MNLPGHLPIQVLIKLARLPKSGFVLDVDLSLPSTGVTAFFGHSGSGKTTLLRCIAGLERAQTAKIKIGEEIWQDDTVFLPAHKRSLGYVFQEDGLLPHLNARENLEYALKRAKIAQNKTLNESVLSVLGISSLLGRMPSALSGGERQRVCIARALLAQPKVLLMDEPLASLDHARKQEILPYLEALKLRVQSPVFYVSHSMEEVSRLADYVVVLQEGKVLSQGPVTEVFSSMDLPRRLNEDTGVIIEGRVTEIDTHWKLVQISFSYGQLWVRHPDAHLEQRVRVRILAKDISIALTPAEDSSILNRIEVNVKVIQEDPEDMMALVLLNAGRFQLVARLTRKSVHHLNLSPGMRVWAQIKSVAIV